METCDADLGIVSGAKRHKARIVGIEVVGAAFVPMQFLSGQCLQPREILRGFDFPALVCLMAALRLNNLGVRGLAPLLPSGRVSAPINGHPVYSRLLLVSQSRYGCPHAVVSVGQFDLEALRVARC